MLVVVAILLAALATGALAWAMWLPRYSVARSLRRVEEYGYGGAVTATLPLAPASTDENRARRLLSRFSPSGYEAALRERFLRAGYYNATPERMLAFRFVGPAAVAVFGAFLIAQNTTLPMIAVVAIALVLAFRVPEFWLSRKIRKRADRVNRELPDFIELLAITVEAGLGFDAATQASIGRMTGPLREEFGLMLQEVRMGAARDVAIAHVVDRVDSRNLRVFAQNLTQGQALGVPLGTILKALASDMRIRRRQDAEEQAQRAPVKMVLVSFALIFPALLVVLLGPAAFRIYDAFVK
jgi:tight adherence protein C